jgi:hypothetical protein
VTVRSTAAALVVLLGATASCGRAASEAAPARAATSPASSSPASRASPDSASPALSTAGTSEGPWSVIAHGRLADAFVERALYERPGTAHFFVHVRIVNKTPSDLGAALGLPLVARAAGASAPHAAHNAYFGVFYPNQWGASDTPHRQVVDETRLPASPLDGATRAELVGASMRGATPQVPASGFLDYYRDYTAAARADVETQSRGHRYVLIVMDGHLDVTDGLEVERVAPPSDDDAAREVALDTPVAWKTVPAGAFVLAER